MRNDILKYILLSMLAVLSICILYVVLSPNVTWGDVTGTYANELLINYDRWHK